MDLRTVVIISALLLMTADSNPTRGPGTNITEPPFHEGTNTTTSHCTCSSTTVPTPPPASTTPVLGLFTVKWTKKCDGVVHLVLYVPSNSSSPVCYSSDKNVKSLMGNVCEQKKGCKGAPRWNKGKETPSSYYITESGEKETTSCETLEVECKVEALPAAQGNQHAYKVVIALLCCVLLVLLLIRFTRPTVKALQKRLSDRRQNRWIGPTQSHSVSYHRGKTAVKPNDALERLAVSDSREPSSNRNSDYNF